MKNETQKTFLGMPMNWEVDKMFKNCWNKDDDQLSRRRKKNRTSKKTEAWK